MLARAALRAGPGLGLLQRSQQLKRAAWLAPAPRRLNSSLPVNIGVLFVPQQEAWVVERMGKFHRILEPGLNFLIPLLDRIRYVQSLKEIVINVPEQSAVTLDNVTLQIDGVLYLRVMDPYKVLPNLQHLCCAPHGLCVMCCSTGSLLPSAHTSPSAWLGVPREAGGLSTQIPPVAPESAFLWQECLWQVSSFPILPCSGGSFSARPLTLFFAPALQASYGVEDPEYAVTQLAQTTMRSELGKLSLDRVFRERESLNANIVDAINQASDCWGIRCLRYEIKDIHVPPRVKESMQMQVWLSGRVVWNKTKNSLFLPHGWDFPSMAVVSDLCLQVEAERRKRATVLESEGTRESAINVAEGQKQAQILASEAEKAEQINKAAGEANAMLVKARAKAEAIQLLAAALAQQHGSAAASLSVAEQYVNAFSKLAKDSNTLLLPSNTGDVTNMVAQALAIYTTLTKPQAMKTQDEASPACEEPQPPSTEVLKAEQAGSS
uniref:Stomatin like 2 n=1 Tax=Strigops habroptila TaxID=2489341 RepID=A0A672V871_STRHB